ncbi:MAG: right-handed parallel beta-helix repeat-containing protein [Candidatus Bathyarchaeota archaeon]|nr:right-handed parallel beta-helix repeat-containing protein [Candidatus Bathyarchaeum sp.]
MANSPYCFVDDVTVAKGVTLTVEPGVVLQLKQTVYSTDMVGRPTEGIVSHSLHVNGTLLADGNIFSTTYGTRISFLQTSTGSKIENSEFIGRYYVDVVGCSPQLKNNSFSGSVTFTLSEGSPIIHGNCFTGLDFISDAFITVDGGSPVISNNTITDDTTVGTFVFLTGTNTAEIYDNNISGNFDTSAVVISSGSPLLEHNFISNHNDVILPINAVGITIYGNSKPVIKSNTIANNKIGMVVFDSDGSPSLTVTGNNFEQNSQYNIYLGEEDTYGTTAPDIDATNNWWGTTDESIISQLIFDYKNNNNLGTITYNPIFSSHNPLAMPNASPNNQVPSSITLDDSTSQQVSTENQQTISQDWLYGIIVALAVVVIFLSVLLVISYKKQRFYSSHLKN